MTLKSIMAADALSVFLNTDEFAETVTYYANGIGQGRSIKAVVERDVQQITDQGLPALATFVNVANHATLGILGTEVDTGVDTLGVSLRYGESAQIRQIVYVEDVDDGMLRIQVN